MDRDVISVRGMCMEDEKMELPKASAYEKPIEKARKTQAQ